MGKFDRYLLSQLLVLFGFFSLILVLIYWINRAVSLFDRLIADGQSAWVFLELTSLSLPGIIRIVLPLSAFVAAVYVTNRMASESELTVVQATGYSPFRLARPVVYFGLIVAILMSILTHILVPLSTERLILRQAEISQNMTARLLTPGEFLTPNPDVTFYIGDVSPNGEMLDIFISESSSETQRTTYTASRAYLVRTDNGPQLVMVEGLTQTLNVETNRLLTTSFEDFAYDIGGLIGDVTPQSTSVNGLSTWALLNPTPEIMESTNQSALALKLRGHDRIAQSTLGFVASLLGFSALIVGGFSRFGLWRYIVFAVGLVILLKVLESVGTNIARGGEALWPFVYLAGISGAAISVALLYIATRPYFFKRRPKAVPSEVAI
ncbi:lipopolysaccharide export system permease protein [Octadecabacter temperatus]|uniref:Putative permease YjgP/YjgQ family protein n=1 Tax=Octadecabacter temperatus TaxID=1458307 RepID=A0A0K0Y5W2_9RHOB|nr:LPS export ABC transporter permease LptF [Octadecabacter temperatus]AKS46383.1 putative permease YjgP/YjgQ family protein [Octadecabacter temperatus]SIO12958.1 lipopolysaccharide export system permease protein [Octadecabacter temperatus]